MAEVVKALSSNLSTAKNRKMWKKLTLPKFKTSYSCNNKDSVLLIEGETQSYGTE
jgi:hypothetical protein